jgi:hypothetical protein
MKREIASYIAQCNVCQRIKAEHQRPTGLLQPLKVPLWKWEEVGMDFITGLPTSNWGGAHFIPVKTTDHGNRLAKLYISRTVSLHGVPKTIVSDQGPPFTSQFWPKL